MADAQPIRNRHKSIALDEIARFDALAGRWWDPDGPMRPLHAMNPLRIGWIDQRIRARFEGARFPGPVRVLDIGCGAGIAAEALARRGHDVLGLDAAGEAIAAARAHAAGQNLPLSYRTGAAEDLIAEGFRAPVVTALEVIEHVPDPAAFLLLLAALIEPGGILFISTLSRTARSLLAAKFAAEYVLRLLPPGTHDWRKFITPAELGAFGRASGFRTAEIAGMVFDLFTRRWRSSRDTSVNYIAMLERS